MKNLKKTALNVMSTAALLTSVAVPVGMVAPSAFAAGSGTLSANTVPSIPNTITQTATNLDGTTAVGTVKVLIPKATLTGSDNTVTISLPHGIKLPRLTDLPAKTVGGATYANYDFNGLEADGTTVHTGSLNNVQVAANGGSNLPVADLSTVAPDAVTVLGDSQIKVKLPSTATINSGDDLILMVNFGKVVVSGAQNGAQAVTFSAPSDSSFPAGNVTVANVQSSSGTVDLAATDTTSGSNQFTFNLNLTEEIQGSLRSDASALKLKLPSGYVWDTATGSTGTTLYGDGSNVVVGNVSGDTLYVKTTAATQNAASVKLPLSFHVNDDNQVKAGPINVYVSGTSTSNVSSLQVGAYGDYSAAVTAASTPDVYAGQSQQTIGDLSIKESVPGTFVNGRTVELTLPDSARWEDVFDSIASTYNTNKGLLPSTAPGSTINITGTNGLNATATFTGTDYRTLKLTFNGNGSLGQTDPGEIDLKNVQIATSARAKGDINVTVGGTSGVTGTVKVATGKATGTIATSKVASLVPGKAGQAIGDITITESAPGAFNRDSVAGATNTDQIKVVLDAVGAQWDAAPTVAVTSGDAKVTNVYTSGNVLYMTLDSASGAAPATISLTGGTVKTDNTLPTGQFNVKLQGTAVDYAANTVAAWANDTTTMSATPVANVTQGLFGSTGNHVVFTIGASSYKLNGNDTTLDAPAFVDANGRTQLPVRALSEALGATVGWDQDSQTVSVLKDGKAIAIKVGSSTMNVGGVPVALDSAAVNKDGRVFLPFRAIAEALGATVAWDGTAQTVTLN